MTDQNTPIKQEVNSSGKPKKTGWRKKVKNFPRLASAHLTSWGLNAAGTAGAGGVLIGNGETLVQKVGNAVLAIPKGIVNSIQNYLHAPEYAEKADAALTYLRDQAPRDVSQLQHATRLLEAGRDQSTRGLEVLNEAKDYLIPGGENGFNPLQAYNGLVEAMGHIDRGVGNIGNGKDKAVEVLGPAVEAIRDLDVNPFLQALHNLADNLASDEVGYTLGVAATSVLTGIVAAQYLGHYWGRRGRPGMVARYIQRKGLKRFAKYFKENPEEIAGEEGLALYEAYLAEHPEKLEAIAERAKGGKK